MPRIIDCFPEWYIRGVFEYLDNWYSDELPWVDGNGQILDQMYFGNHSGYKETSPLLDKFIEQNRGNVNPNILTEEQIIALVDILYTRYGVQWSKLYKVLSAEYNPIENYSMIETETPELKRDKELSIETDYTVSTDSNVNTNVFGFNSIDSVPQGDSDGISTVNTKGEADKNKTIETESQTGKRTLTRSGNIGVTTSQQMLESEIKLWEWNFYETIFKDVDTVLTVPKYNFY